MKSDRRRNPEFKGAPLHRPLPPRRSAPRWPWIVLAIIFVLGAGKLLGDLQSSCEKNASSPAVCVD